MEIIETTNLMHTLIKKRSIVNRLIGGFVMESIEGKKRMVTK